MSNKSKYRELCKSEPTIPIFSRDWWLDAVCGETNWDVVLVEKGGEIVGSLPFYFKKRFGSRIITMPPLTQTMGPWIKNHAQRCSKRVSCEVKVVSELIDSLPPFGSFDQRFHYSVTNWLPFYWRGFQQTTRYTYIIPDLTNLEKVFKEFDHSVRSYISKAQSNVEVVASDDIRTFYEINSWTFRRQGMDVPYSYDFVRRLDSKCHENGKRRILMAKDKSDEIRAALYLVWCEESAYTLMSGINPKFRTDGAMKLLVWEAIKFASEVIKQFDFEGSMLKAIEMRNRSFGAIQVPYSYVTKTNAFHLKLLNMAKQLIIDLGPEK
jgi:hypothetical protein